MYVTQARVYKTNDKRSHASQVFPSPNTKEHFLYCALLHAISPTQQMISAPQQTTPAPKPIFFLTSNTFNTSSSCYNHSIPSCTFRHCLPHVIRSYHLSHTCRSLQYPSRTLNSDGLEVGFYFRSSAEVDRFGKGELVGPTVWYIATS